MNKKTRTKLRKLLPNNYMEILMTEFDYSSSMVYMVLRGDRKNSELMNRAYALAKLTKLQTEEFEKQVESL